jgi:hypothetical protein
MHVLREMRKDRIGVDDIESPPGELGRWARVDYLKVPFTDRVSADSNNIWIHVHPDDVVRRRVFEKETNDPSPPAAEVEDPRLGRNGPTKYSAMPLDELVELETLSQSGYSTGTNELFLKLIIWQSRESPTFESCIY